MGATKTLLTAEEFENYPFAEDKRYELDEGELIEMIRKSTTGEVLISENLYALSANTSRAPGDRSEEVTGARVIPIVPDIAAEVLSPSETPRSQPGKRSRRRCCRNPRCP